MGVTFSIFSLKKRKLDKLIHSFTQKKRRSSHEVIEKISKWAIMSMSHDPRLYHNDRHIQEVTEFTKEIFDEIPENILDKEMKKCIIIAAALHDICHPAGSSNKQVLDYVAQRLCDNDILETTHLETIHSHIAYELLRKSGSFSSLGETKEMHNIYIITELILSTDLQTYIENECVKQLSNIEQLRIAKLIIRCADLCHLVKDLDYHIARINGLNFELGFKLTNSQNLNFIITFAIPLFNELHTICNTKKTKYWVEQVHQKIEYWTNGSVHS